jgi:hypothetical protein
VHLDFHTSEHIPDVGADFDPDEFASTLENARVDSVTCFARCHHGWIYFDTKVHPERRHPTLKRNLLKEQIDACHARGIRVPIYITVQWDHYTAERHPEWVALSETGALRGTPPYEPGFYRSLCVNTPYVDFLKEHVREVLETLPTDGIFFDIVQPLDCSCRACREGMLAEGLEPSNGDHRRRYGLSVINEFKRDMTRFVRQLNSACTIFYNAGHIGPRHRAVADAYTHFEIESLPSGGWGYMHFPVTARFARNLGVDVLGMTGKFHTSWGDFHSFKNEAALQFECFHMLALNAKCSVGDQLHPSGRICSTTYDLIGSVYADVEMMEPWCRNAESVTEVGVFTPEEFSEGRHNAAIAGATRILQEAAQQFDILDTQSEFERYRVLVLPDNIPPSPLRSRRSCGTISRAAERSSRRLNRVSTRTKRRSPSTRSAFATRDRLRTVPISSCRQEPSARIFRRSNTSCICAASRSKRTTTPRCSPQRQFPTSTGRIVTSARTGTRRPRASKDRQRLSATGTASSSHILFSLSTIGTRLDGSNDLFSTR